MKLQDYLPQSKLVTPNDTRKLPTRAVIDAHSHWGKLLLGEDYADKYVTADVVDAMRAQGIKHIVNLDGYNGDDLKRMMDKQSIRADFFSTSGNVDTSRMEEDGFEDYVFRTVEESRRLGISGLKFWKVISLVQKDSSGKYVPINDPRLRPIWHAAAQYHLPVTIHIADPIAFFDPIDSRNERYEELQAHPDWSFAAPELYSFRTLMSQQEDMVRSNPDTTFIIAHVGSCAEDLAWVSSQLDKYPNMYVDLAQRFAELGRQPYSARRFLEKYSSRVLYGSDCTPENFIYYKSDFRFLETMDEYFPYYPQDCVPPQGRWNIYGVGLSDAVLDNIYVKNAERLFFGDRT